MTDAGRRLYFHAGAPKAASTLIQLRLAQLRDKLIETGLDYSPGGFGYGTAATSGNGHAFLESAQTRNALLAQVDPRARRGCIFSTEAFMYHHEWPERLGEALDQVVAEGFADMNVLVLMRDPVSHAASLWQQFVRHNRNISTPLDVFCAEHYDFPSRVRTLVDRADADPRLEVTLRRFPGGEGNPLAPLFEWLDLPVSLADGVGGGEHVNLSLSRDDAELVRILNMAHPKIGEQVAVALRKGRTDPVIRIVPGEAAQKAMLDRLAPDLELIDARLPDGERLVRAPVAPPPEPEGGHRFSEAQLSALAEVVGARLTELETTVESTRRDAERMRRLRVMTPRPVRRLARRIRELLRR